MYGPFRQIFTVTGDVTVKEDVQRIMDSVVGHYGKLDVLVSASAIRETRISPQHAQCFFIHRTGTPIDGTRRQWVWKVVIITYLAKISQNALFCNRNLRACVHFCYKLVHCETWGRCTLGFVRPVNDWPTMTGCNFVMCNFVMCLPPGQQCRCHPRP